MQDGAPSGGGSGTRCETREDERRRHRMKFLFPQDDTPSRSLVKVDTVHDGGGIERPSSTPTFVHL